MQHILRQMERSFKTIKLSQTLDTCCNNAFRSPKFKNHIKININSIPYEMWLSRLPLVGC